LSTRSEIVASPFAVAAPLCRRDPDAMARPRLW
jgi:hypothetical protein